MKNETLDFSNAGAITTKRVFLMSMPIFVELLLQMLVGNVDQFMLSSYSQISVAAIGNSNLIMNLIIVVFSVMGSATTILVSQYIGAKKRDKIDETCTVSLLIVFVAGVIATLIVVVFSPNILDLLHAPEEIKSQAVTYLRIVGVSILIQGFYFNFAAFIRSFSLMKYVMLVSVIMNLTNIFGNAVLINGYLGFPRLGIAGAAISTSISKCIGLGVMIYTFRKKLSVKLSFSYIKHLSFDTVKRILRIAIPSGGEGFSYNLSQIAIMGFINTFGTAVITTKVYSSMMANVAYVYAIAISQANQIAMGYLIGGNHKDKVPKRVWSTVFISLFVCVGVTLLLLLNSDFAYGIFTDNQEVLQLGSRILKVELLLEIGRAINIVMVNALCAAGDIKMPIVTGITFQWAVAVLLSYLLGVHFGFGLVGIWAAMAFDENCRGIIYVFRFLSGKWKKKSVMH